MHACKWNSIYFSIPFNHDLMLGLKLANISETLDLIGQDFKLVSSRKQLSPAKDGRRSNGGRSSSSSEEEELNVNVTHIEKCHFKVSAYSSRYVRACACLCIRVLRTYGIFHNKHQ